MVPEATALAELVEPEESETSAPKGEKKEEKQQTHITKAIVKSPIFPGLLLLSVDFLSRTKLTSELLNFSLVVPLLASLSQLY